MTIEKLALVLSSAIVLYMTRLYTRATGFTIVELMIVIVIIGILATIIGLNYQNTTLTGRTTQAKSNAYAVQKVAEAFYADKNRAPGSLSDFSYNPLAKVPQGVTILSGNTPLSPTNGQSAVEYTYLGSPDAATGGRVRYWDFNKGNITDMPLYVGDASVSSSGWHFF